MSGTLGFLWISGWIMCTWSVYMIYIDIYRYICVWFAHLHMCLLVCMHVCVLLCLYTSRYICMHVYVYIDVFPSHLHLYISSFHPHNHYLSPNSPRLMFLFVDCATVDKVYLILFWYGIKYIELPNVVLPCIYILWCCHAFIFCGVAMHLYFVVLPYIYILWCCHAFIFCGVAMQL